MPRSGHPRCPAATAGFEAKAIGLSHRFLRDLTQSGPRPTKDGSAKGHPHAFEPFGDAVEEAGAIWQSRSDLRDRHVWKGPGEIGETAPCVLLAAGKLVSR